MDTVLSGIGQRPGGAAEVWFVDVPVRLAQQLVVGMAAGSCVAVRDERKGGYGDV